MPFTLSRNDKFGLVAAHMVYTDLKDEQAQLSDGTFALTKVPFEIESTWQKWLGSIKADKLKDANLVLIRSMQSKTPEIFNNEQVELGKHVTQLFYMLQLGGVLEYGEADNLKGSFYDDGFEIRQHGVLPQFYPCKGYSRTPVTIERLEEAAKLRAVLPILYSGNGDFARFGRGLNILNDSLKYRIGQEKLHQAVRALEALILPQTGNTKKQFIHRCQTFAKANDNAAKILGEIFDMRSDSEHVHDWAKSLADYPEKDRDDIAWQRTRQIESLARFAYTRIMLDEKIRSHFKDEILLDDFWKKVDDATRRKMWGRPFDLESIPLVEDYDGFGRAKKKTF